MKMLERFVVWLAYGMWAKTLDRFLDKVGKGR